MNYEEHLRRLRAQLEWERQTSPPRWLAAACIAIGSAGLLVALLNAIGVLNG